MHRPMFITPELLLLEEFVKRHPGDLSPRYEWWDSVAAMSQGTTSIGAQPTKNLRLLVTLLLLLLA